jgi:hypothetical protein
LLGTERNVGAPPDLSTPLEGSMLDTLCGLVGRLSLLSKEAVSRSWSPDVVAGLPPSSCGDTGEASEAPGAGAWVLSGGFIAVSIVIVGL